VCEKCIEIDRTIERLRAVAARIQDERMLNRLSTVVAELELQKVELHLDKQM